jgi:hypothetical protein
MHLTPVLEDVILIRAEVEVKAALANLADAVEMVEAGGVVLVSEDGVVIAGQGEGFVNLDAGEGTGVFVGAG